MTPVFLAFPFVAEYRVYHICFHDLHYNIFKAQKIVYSINGKTGMYIISSVRKHIGVHHHRFFRRLLACFLLLLFITEKRNPHALPSRF